MKKYLLVIMSLIAFKVNAQWVDKSHTGNLNFTNLFFVNNQVGFLISNNSLSGKVIKTEDGGVTWKNNISIQGGLGGIYFLNSNDGYLTTSLGAILKTIDAGVNWTSYNTVNGMGYNSIYMYNKNSGCAVGGDGAGNGSIIRTIDGTNFNASVKSPSISDLNSVFFTTSKTGFAVGNSGTVLKTSDGGANWNYSGKGITITGSTSFKSIFFTDSLNGIIVGSNIYKTSDGGLSWAKKDIPLSSSQYGLNSVFFVNSTTGYICGRVGTLLKTIDSGETWVAENSNVNYDLKSIKSPLNSTKLISVGSNSTFIQKQDLLNSIEDSFVIKLTLAPNPSSNGYFQVISDEAIQQIKVTNTLGEYEFFENTKQISTKLKGLLLVELISNKGKFIQKLIVE